LHVRGGSRPRRSEMVKSCPEENGGFWRKAAVGRFVYLRFCIGLIMCP
jgi:hypothetical protein